MKHKLTNEGCREQALNAIAEYKPKQAMRWYNTARARTIGHKKSDDYERLAKDAADLAGIEYNRNDFASDDEAADIKYSWQK